MKDIENPQFNTAYSYPTLDVRMGYRPKGGSFVYHDQSSNNRVYNSAWQQPDYTTRGYLNGTFRLNTQQAGRIDATGASIAGQATDKDRTTVLVKAKVRDIEGSGNWSFYDTGILRDSSTLKAMCKKMEGDDGYGWTDADLPAGMTGKIDSTADTITVTFNNVPAGISPRMDISKFGYGLYDGPASYGLAGISVESTFADGTTSTITNFSNFPVNLAEGVGAGGGSIGEAVNRSFETSATVSGAGQSVDNPALVAGSTAPVRLSVANKGNVPMFAPSVKMPDGTVKQFADFGIQPGEAKVIAFDYKFPADVSQASFETTFLGADPQTARVFIDVAPNSTYLR